MGYTARDLYRNAKEILDAAEKTPVRIRRGDVYFEITKVKYVAVNDTEKNTSRAHEGQRHEPTVVSDSQEYEEPTGPYPVANSGVSGKTSLDDMINSGMIKRGTNG